jgi:hypothetical protein
MLNDATGFITNLKYLATHKNWNSSFQWLTQFLHDYARKHKHAYVLGALAATILGGILLFTGETTDEYFGGEERSWST